MLTNENNWRTLLGGLDKQEVITPEIARLMQVNASEIGLTLPEWVLKLPVYQYYMTMYRPESGFWFDAKSFNERVDFDRALSPQ